MQRYKLYYNVVCTLYAVYMYAVDVVYDGSVCTLRCSSTAPRTHDVIPDGQEEAVNMVTFLIASTIPTAPPP